MSIERERRTPALGLAGWADENHHFVQCFDSWDPAGPRGVGEISAGPGYFHLTAHEHPHFADFSAPTDRHRIAALALHRQKFGFTWQDVAVLHALMGAADDPSAWFCEVEAGRREVMERARSLAARIAALLPPRPDPEGPSFVTAFGAKAGGSA